MFQGRANLNLDSKGRLAVPAKYRDVLTAECAGQLVITADSSKYLLIYPKPEWNVIHQDLMSRSNANPMVKKLQRILIGNAQDVEIDSAGRVLIAPELRRHVGLEKNVMLVGLGRKFELWDETKWNEEMNEPLSLEDLGSELEGFSW
ncbi:MAG TPA: division/cell wall cluster transcriptional repressor MraZ [Burkholderiales bacterium]|nr:division/cell wall cluster transcriptional repressor MraZ [Burkholderiales bacterium]